MFTPMLTPWNGRASSPAFTEAFKDLYGEHQPPQGGGRRPGGEHAGGRCAEDLRTSGAKGRYATVPARGDFLVEGKFLFEIGGKAKERNPDQGTIRHTRSLLILLTGPRRLPARNSSTPDPASLQDLSINSLASPMRQSMGSWYPTDSSVSLSTSSTNSPGSVHRRAWCLLGPAVISPPTIRPQIGSTLPPPSRATSRGASSRACIGILPVSPLCHLHNDRAIS
jgi:hypothetical protein